MGADRPASDYAEAAFDTLTAADDPAVPDDGDWDEAVFQSVEDEEGSYADRLILRAGDDVLQLDVTGAEEPAGGRDALAQLAAAAAATLADED